MSEVGNSTPEQEISDPTPGRITAAQAKKMRQALRDIDQLLESPKWYDGEDAMESLLDRLGFIVQGALP